MAISIVDTCTILYMPIDFVSYKLPSTEERT